ncbi:MAG: AtpZ/AtpI family protein [Holosporales bacterium]|jgi:F0F1-type ATP synthase assembly protein I|nr:AtpZ/AtpI family protein [Holosporales bacterium]
MEDKSFETRLQHLENRLKTPYYTRRVGLSRQENPLIRGGIEFFSGVAANMLLGIAVDKYWHTYPYGLVIMFLVGICTGFVNVFRLVNKKPRS